MFRTHKHFPGRARRLAALAILPLLILLTLTGGGQAQAVYLDGSSYTHVEDPAGGTVFLTDDSASLLSVTRGSELRLTPGVTVTVRYQDRARSAVTADETLDELLTRLDIHPSPLEMTAISKADDGMEIVVDAEFIFYERTSQVTEHETVYRYNDKKPAWQETVVQEGHDGEHTEVYEIVYQDGQEISRQLIELVDTEPQPTIIEKGTIENFANHGDKVSSIVTDTDGNGTITLENGEVLTFHEAKEMTGTAYTKSEGGVGAYTASGTPVRVGAVAVDKDVIPLGSKLYIVSNDGKYVYGFAVAEDTGVHGSIIDLYMDTYSECLDFGRRGCTVYILD